MGLNEAASLGRLQRFYVRSESVAGTWQAPRGQDAVKVLKAAIDLSIDRKDRTDSRQHADRVERIQGLRKVTWSANGYFMSGAAAGTAPDQGELLRGGFGTETVNASTSVVYTLSSDRAIPTFTLHHESGDASGMSACVGAVVNQMKFSLKGGEAATVDYSGMAFDYIPTGASTLNDASANNGDTTVTIATADIANFATHSYIQIGTSTAHEVTAGAGTATLTISPGLSGGQSNGATVTPYVPTETTVGTPIPGILASLTLGSVTMPITEVEIEIDNGIKDNSGQAGITYVTDFYRGYRTVKGSLTVRALRSQFQWLTKYNSDASTRYALSFVAGTTAGYIATFSLPYCELSIPKIDVPEEAESTIKIPFDAFASSSGNDAITLTFT